MAVKQANPDFAELDRLQELSDLGIYAGNDDMLLEVLRRGGLGGICVSSHVAGPRMAEMARLARAGDLAGATAVDEELRALYKALFVTTNPIPVKAALAMLGHEGRRAPAAARARHRGRRGGGGRRAAAAPAARLTR